MKNFFVIMVMLLLILESCSKLNPLHNASRPLSSRRDSPYMDRDSSWLWRSYPFTHGDTLFYVCSIDKEKSEINLYENWRHVRTVKGGESTPIPMDEELVHLVDGHVYTEYFGKTHNIVCQDGNVVAEIDRDEYLIGILSLGSHLYLLSQSSPNSGFTLWRDGLRLRIRDDVSVFGDLQDPSYAPHGALYQYLGHYRFGYITEDNYCTICGDDGIFEARRDSKILDAKMCGIRIRTALKTNWGQTWYGARIWPSDSLIVTAGECLNSVSHAYLCACCEADFNTEVKRFRTFFGEESYLFYSKKKGLYGIKNFAGGQVRLLSPGGDVTLDGTYMYFSPNCAKVCDDGIVMVLNQEEGPPVLWFKGKSRNLGWIKGAVCSVELTVNPAS